LLAERFLEQHGIEPRIGMEIGSNETIKQAVMAGLGIAFISAHTIAAEIGDSRLAILDVVGLPEIRQWFVVRPAAKRMMPAARSLRDFLVAEGRRFLPNLKHGRRGGKMPALRKWKAGLRGGRRPRSLRLAPARRSSGSSAFGRRVDARPSRGAGVSHRWKSTRIFCWVCAGVPALDARAGHI
jgi:hypothetical protein